MSCAFVFLQYSFDSFLGLLLCDAQRNAAVLRAACFSRVVCYRMIRAVAFRVHARGIDTERDNFMHYVVGTILREFEVCGSITLIVRVATDSYVDVGIGL